MDCVANTRSRNESFFSFVSFAVSLCTYASTTAPFNTDTIFSETIDSGGRLGKLAGEHIDPTSAAG